MAADVSRCHGIPAVLGTGNHGNVMNYLPPHATNRRESTLGYEYAEHGVLHAQLREENALKTGKINELECHVVDLENKLRAVENRGSEVEKLELLLKSVRNRLDNIQCENREKELELRENTKQLEEKGRRLQEADKWNVGLLTRVEDLKEQVKEELMRNDKMEQKVSELASLREVLKQKEAQVAELEAEMDKKSAVLSHARMTLRAEREKVTALHAQIDERSTMQEDMALIQAESLTLKRLLIGKDTLLVQKTQELELAKKVIRELDKSGQTTIALEYLERQRPLYPMGVHFNDPEKKQCLKDGSLEKFETTDKLFIMDPNLKKGVQQTAFHSEGDHMDGPPADHDQGQGLLEILLRGELERTSIERTNSAPNVRLQNYAGCGAANSNTGHAEDAHNAPHRNRPSETRMPSGRPRTAAVVKPPNYQPNQTFANFRTFRGKMELGNNNNRQAQPKLSQRECQSANRSRQLLVKQQTKIDVSVTSAGPGVLPQKAWSALKVAPPSGSACNVWEEELSVFQRDLLASKFVHLGDRVIIDLAAQKGDKEKLASGMVRFVGHVDTEVEDFQIHVGVKLDDPVGDMDGVYKGKRYFTTLNKHGKLVRIAKVKAVLRPKASTFRSLEDCIQNYRSLLAGGLSSSSLNIKSKPS